MICYEVYIFLLFLPFLLYNPAPIELSANVQRMKIHGIEKPFSADGIVVPSKNNFQIKSNFNIKLTDFNIKIPKLMIMKIDENITVHIDFFVKKLGK